MARSSSIRLPSYIEDAAWFGNPPLLSRLKLDPRRSSHTFSVDLPPTQLLRGPSLPAAIFGVILLVAPVILAGIVNEPLSWFGFLIAFAVGALMLLGGGTYLGVTRVVFAVQHDEIATYRWRWFGTRRRVGRITPLRAVLRFEARRVGDESFHASQTPPASARDTAGTPPDAGQRQWRANPQQEMPTYNSSRAALFAVSLDPRTNEETSFEIVRVRSAMFGLDSFVASVMTPFANRLNAALADAKAFVQEDSGADPDVGAASTAVSAELSLSSTHPHVGTAPRLAADADAQLPAPASTAAFSLRSGAAAATAATPATPPTAIVTSQVDETSSAEVGLSVQTTDADPSSLTPGAIPALADPAPEHTASAQTGAESPAALEKTAAPPPSAPLPESAAEQPSSTDQADFFAPATQPAPAEAAATGDDAFWFETEDASTKPSV